MKFITLILLTALFSFQSFAQQSSPTYINNNKMKILSWNIYMLPYISLFNNNADRAMAIADELENSEYHILVFQEAFSSKCRNLLAKRLLKKYPYQYGPANKNRLPFKTNSGLWVVSKIPLKNLGEIQFSRCKGYDAIARKGAVLFQGSFQGSTFQLLTTHLQSEHSHDLRSRQCQEIRDHLLNPHYSIEIPQLICGDFNIEMDDKRQYNKMLLTLDARDGELSGPVKVTYDERNNKLARQTTGRSKTIDYVLVRNSDLIHNIERKVQIFLAKVGGVETNLSDHYAMEFSVNFIPVFNKQTAQLNFDY